MADSKTAVTELEMRMRQWLEDHTARYLRSGGTEGHFVDMQLLGGHALTPTLLLRTKGRRSGAVRYAPVIYGCMDGEVSVIASRGGADIHPAWYFNMLGEKDVEFQIGAEAFRGPWHNAEGREREEIWSVMRRVYPPYDDYQARTERDIPVVVMTAHERIATFHEHAADASN